jgi:hypothetical protein
MANYETRKRDIEMFYRLGTLVEERSFDGGLTWSAGTTHPSVKIVAGEETTSKENPDWYQNLKTVRKIESAHTGTSDYVAGLVRNRDIGGDFDSVKHDFWISHPKVHLDVSVPGQRHYVFDGAIVPEDQSVSSSNIHWPVVPRASDLELAALGTKAIALTIPTNPNVNLAAAMGELRNDGLAAVPSKALAHAMLKRYRLAGKAASVGSEYLNVVFGWKPFLKDVKDLGQSIRDSKTILEQFARDSGKPIRRRFNFPDVTNKTITTLGSGSIRPAFAPFWYSDSSSVLVKERSEKIRTWFSGCYTYYLDPGEHARGKLMRAEQLANKLYGTRINPEVIWELAPWSWAVDWAVNIGDIMTNVSALQHDSLVIRWAYVMREHRITDTYSLWGPTFKTGLKGPYSQSFTTIRKRRLKATPYGFGLSFDGFSTQQLAILAALGISRSG